MKTKTYNDNSRKPSNWTDKKLMSEYKKRSGASPDGAYQRMTALMSGEILRRRRERFSG